MAASSRAEAASHSSHDGESYDRYELAYDVLDGLTRPFKELSSRFLYDKRGAELFDRILGLPEYYQGRAEMEILRQQGTLIMSFAEPDELVDVGAGSGVKTKTLLEAAGRTSGLRYFPVDKSLAMLRQCIQQMERDLPDLAVAPVQADFDSFDGSVPAPTRETKRLVTMFGGTLGNLLPGSRLRFWRKLAALAGPRGTLLLGVDLLNEDPQVTEAAYDDAAGVTSAFNKNLLQVINDRLEADFDVAAFDHLVIFDDANGWIEMRLRARHRCRVQIGLLDRSVQFEPGEEIRTEVSAKYSQQDFEREASWAGMQVRKWLTDSASQFALPLLTAGR
jgi:L-histidine N-alpha-methyltransferase